LYLTSGALNPESALMNNLFFLVMRNIRILFSIPVYFIALCLIAVCVAFFANPVRSNAQTISFERVYSQIDGDTTVLTRRETSRIERFLGKVFPTRSMQRVMHKHDKPVLRRGIYDVIYQYGQRYLVAAFMGRWDGTNDRTLPIHVLAIYQLGDEGPNQVWRSRAWQANYYGMSLSSAEMGMKSVLLFKEGGVDASEFSIAGVFTFTNGEKGLYIHDLTPQLRMLRVRASFPFRPLFARDILLERNEFSINTLQLSASDEEFTNYALYQPTTHWRYDKRTGRFRLYKEKSKGAVLTSTTSDAVPH
jgi:hypothetical protein